MKNNSTKLVFKKEFYNSFSQFKKFLILILISFLGIINTYSQWEPCNKGIVHSTGIDYTGIACFIIDNNNIYTSTGVDVFITTDNGDNWFVKNNGLTGRQGNIILSLAICGNYIFAGTLGGGIYLSTDKGESWERRSIGLPFFISGLDTVFKFNVYSILINGNNIFACGRDGVYLSTDNGSIWNLKSNGLPQLDATKREVFSLIIKENNIFAGTENGVYMTSDNGENWIPKNKGMENWSVYTIAMKGSYIYAGARNGLFLSTDSGESWKNIGFQGTTIDAIIIKGNYIFAAGLGVNWSSDNGNSWSSNNTGLTDIVVLSLIVNGEYIFAGTNEAGVFRAKLSDLGITDVKETEQTNEIKIFPNPASDEFRLKLQAPFETTVQLSVFDFLGNCVLSQMMQSTEGTNEKTINCEKMPQGYYYVKVNMNEVVETVPMVIVK